MALFMPGTAGMKPLLVRAVVAGACLPLYYYRERILGRFRTKPSPRRNREEGPAPRS